MAEFDSNPAPQFGKVEYLGSSGNDHCQFCHQPISGSYFRVNKAMACAACAQQAQGLAVTPSHSAYMRALLFGSGAAVAGMVLYATFEIVTGIIIGYASLAVGWMVGKAMLAGSKGAGGRRFQITAAALTYLAVSMAAIPVGLHYAFKHNDQVAAQRAKHAGSQQDLADEQRQLEAEPGQAGKPAPQRDSGGSNSSPAAQQPEAKSALQAIAGLLMLGVASPFLELADNPVGALIGIVILLVGIRIAWRMTEGSRIDVMGPFESKPSS